MAKITVHGGASNADVPDSEDASTPAVEPEKSATGVDASDATPEVADGAPADRPRRRIDRTPK